MFYILISTVHSLYRYIIGCHMLVSLKQTLLRHRGKSGGISTSVTFPFFPCWHPSIFLPTISSLLQDIRLEGRIHSYYHNYLVRDLHISLSLKWSHGLHNLCPRVKCCTPKIYRVQFQDLLSLMSPNYINRASAFPSIDINRIALKKCF